MLYILRNSLIHGNHPVNRGVTSSECPVCGGAIDPAMAASLMTIYSEPITSTSRSAARLVALPLPAALNMLMIIGFILVAAVILLNIGERDYSFAMAAGD